MLGLRDLRADRSDDLALSREATERLLGDGLALHLHQELPAGTGLQLGVEAKLRLQRGRRTDGPGLVASGVAIQDGDHGAASTGLDSEGAKTVRAFPPRVG
jgi:hypothetical protein